MDWKPNEGLIAGALDQARVQALMAAHTHAWPQTSEARSYYTFGGDRVAMRTGGEVHYLHADHLGTAALTSDSNVAAIHAVRRYLFGA